MKSQLLLLLALAPAAFPADFAKDVQPVLARKCVMCHGSAQQISGLRLDHAAGLAQGGYSGPVVQPGNAAASKLIERVSSSKEGFRMPPSGPALKPEEVAAL
ncbi:c-type cytochrome domain-containing protein, partial [Nostoc sp. NIES-2111]